MDKYKKLENITNALKAAEKIRSLYSSSYDNRQGLSVQRDNMCLLCDALNVINSLYPSQNRNNLGDIINKTIFYSNTYRNMKRHFRRIGTQRFDRNMFLDTMKVVKPLLSSKYSKYVDKITKIHEILKS